MTFTADNFEKEVLSEDVGAVLVDFWAPWCGPCRMVGPIVEEIEVEVAGKAKVGKINIDDNGDIAQKYGVLSIPTLIVFKNGQEQERLVGAHPKPALLAMLAKYV